VIASAFVVISVLVALGVCVCCPGIPAPTTDDESNPSRRTERARSLYERISDRRVLPALSPSASYSVGHQLGYGPGADALPIRFDEQTPLLINAPTDREVAAMFVRTYSQPVRTSMLRLYYIFASA